jgi:hypothetical protein
MNGLRITTMLSLLFTLGSVAAGPTATVDTKGKTPVPGDVVTAETDLDFLEFLGSADDPPPDPDAPYDEPVLPTDRVTPTGKGKVTP